jgi:phosphatidylglycerol:prolipoprotein diacylglycerol transferase
VSGPLIPYITLPEIPLAFLQHLPWLGELIDPKHPPSIKPFGTLVALGVYLGAAQTLRRARERGYDAAVMSDYIVWTVGTGFVISHLFDAILYNPERVLADPIYLLKIWDGLSSYGGFIGAVIGSLAYKWYRRRDVLGFIDVTVSGMPLAWVFGRTGCSVVHDHPGIKSDIWFAVQYPARGGGTVGRLDLGLIEMVLTIPLAVAVWWLWRRKAHRPDGYYIALVAFAYAPVRFVLDYFRIGADEAAMGADERYGSLTPAQWSSIALVAVGVYFARKVWLELRNEKDTAAAGGGGAAPPGAGAAAESGAAADADEAPGEGADAEPDAAASEAAGDDAPAGNSPPAAKR